MKPRIASLLFRLPVPALLLAGLAAIPTAVPGNSTRPVGYIIQTVPAGQTRSFSIPLDAPPSSLADSVGNLTEVGEDYFENADAEWVPGAFSTKAAPYFVRLSSGSQAGRLFQIDTSTDNTATRLHVVDDGIDLLELVIETGEGGTSYEIIPADTLATLFGTVGEGSLILQGGVEPDDADLIMVWAGASWLRFYYNTEWDRWARDRDTEGHSSRNDYLLRPDRGFVISRRGETPLDMSLIGRVLITPPQAIHSRSLDAMTFLATMQATDITLAELAMQASYRSTDWVGATDPTEADQLLVWAGASWLRFYYHTDNSQWQRIGETDRSRDNYTIRAGTPIMVLRQNEAQTAEEKTIRFPALGS